MKVLKYKELNENSNGGGLTKLIEALNIFIKYGYPYSPTHCEHDTLYVMIDPEDVSEEDKEKLEILGFSPNDMNGFSSYYFGSA
jgi:hypothetical protein